MTHDQVRDNEIAEAYLRGRLGEAERASFEDHCYVCDECFEQLRTLQSFTDGVREAARIGVLPAPRPAAPRWVWALPTAASVALAGFSGWAMLIEVPRLREQANAAAARAAGLENDLNGAKLALARPARSEPNLPLVMLEATRSANPPAVTVPPGADSVALWVEPPSASAAKSYRFEIAAVSGSPVVTVEGLVRNGYGALAASVPAARLSPGSYRARLYSAAPEQLVGEYRFDIRK